MKQDETQVNASEKSLPIEGQPSSPSLSAKRRRRSERPLRIDDTPQNVARALWGERSTKFPKKWGKSDIGWDAKQPMSLWYISPFMNRLLELVREIQSQVNRIAEIAAEKREVQALETRVAARETAMPWPTATPTVTPTPTPFPDEARNFAQQLAVDDHAGLWSNFSDKSEDEQTRIVDVYQEYFVKTSEACNLDLAETYEVIQKYAEPIDFYSPPALETRLRNMGMGGAGWRLDFVARIATDYMSYGWIRDRGCDRYLEWYTDG